MKSLPPTLACLVLFFGAGMHLTVGTPIATTVGLWCCIGMGITLLVSFFCAFFWAVNAAFAPGTADQE